MICTEIFICYVCSRYYTGDHKNCRVKKEAIEEFEYFNKVELAAYEEELEADLLRQLEVHELEFNSEADRIDAESDSILNELEDLTAQLKESKSF